MPPNFSTTDFLASCVLLMNVGIPAEQAEELVRNTGSTSELVTRIKVVLQERYDAVIWHQMLYRAVMPVIQAMQELKPLIVEFVLSERFAKADVLRDERDRILQEIQPMMQELLVLNQYLYPESTASLSTGS